ncbi:MAG: bifunctional folylpolyglutamate synthase/dihydrofolate synthase, partial [Synergistaceae bacterium]|nr:bifunctional folylpolyglutamate synthase/dihydrofolate synthase [Synergistaceae bacterium]
MNFEDLERVLYSNSDNRIIPGLERISRLLEEMGNPQDSFKSVHVVGTNGKGSTGAFISSVLRASGYKTGFYSSPHLESLGERLLVDGIELPAEQWLNAVNIAVDASRKAKLSPSYF